MKIAIVGTGITGLATAYHILKQRPNAHIFLFEKTDQVGGLGGWTKFDGVDIEPFYHHYFLSDKKLLKLIEELGLSEKLYFSTSKNANLYDDGYHSLSTPKDLLIFPKLSLWERLKLVFNLTLLKLDTTGIRYDNITAQKWLTEKLGRNTFKILWKPLMDGKYDNLASKISMSWFWGRIHDRTFELGYMKGSNRVLFEALSKKVKRMGAKVILNTSIKRIKFDDFGCKLVTDSKVHLFDSIVWTPLSPALAKISNLPQKTKNKLASINHIGTVCCLISLKYKLQENYWVNLCMKNSPFVIAVEHTNFIKYAKSNKHLVYLAKYTDSNSAFYNLSYLEHKKLIINTLRSMNPNFKTNWIKKIKIFKAPKTQTIFPIKFLVNQPQHDLIPKRMYLANIDQTYPHDRNLGIGVVIGAKVAKYIVDQHPIR